MFQKIPIILLVFFLFTIFPSGTFAANKPSENGDVSPQATDIVATNIQKDGRGITFKLAFAKPLTGKEVICWNISGRKYCLNQQKNKLTHRGLSIPAFTKVTRGRFLSIWARSAHLNIQINKKAVYTPLVTTKNCIPQSVISEESVTKPLPCFDRTKPISFKYSYPSSCDRPPNGKLYLNGPRNRKLVALTYDDGPHAATKPLLDVLKRENVPATFFMNGIHVNSHKKLVMRMKNEGHELANHSWGHELLPSSSSISRTQAIIQKVTQYRPCSFRPPYGANNSSLLTRLKALRMAAVNWDIDTRDWQSHNTSSIISIGSRGINGSIILSHDGGGGNYATANAASATIKNYKRRGYEFVTVDELLGWMDGPTRR